MKNSFLNFVGQVLPLFIMVVTIPYVIRGLGVERYGIFVLVWVIINYFNVFELGLGATTSKFIAEALGKEEIERVLSIYWTSLMYVFFLGLIGSAALLLVAPTVAEHIFNVQADLVVEMKTVLRISSVLVSIILIRSVLNGVLEAYQRFDLINLLRVPSNVLSQIIPVIVVFMGKGLVMIIFLLTIKELMMLFGYYLLSRRVIPKGRWHLLEFNSAKPLLAFGGWLCITRIISWVMLNVDKFFIGTLLTVGAVTYYAVPWSVTRKMTIIVASIVPVIFPAVSQFNATDKERLTRLFMNSLKYTILLVCLPTLILAVFSREILILWLGDDFQQSVIVLQILALGCLMSSISWIFGTFIQATGHPKIVTILGLLQAPINILVVWVLTKNFGLTGAALGWAMLRGLGVIVLYMTCLNLNIFRVSWKIDTRLLKASAGILLILGVNLILKSFLNLSILNTVGNALILIIGYTMITWHYIVDDEQKGVIFKNMKFIASNKLNKSP